jgi:hypothetical protein
VLQVWRAPGCQEGRKKSFGTEKLTPSWAGGRLENLAMRDHTKLKAFVLADQVVFSYRLGFLSTAGHAELLPIASETAKVLNGLLRALGKTDQPPARPVAEICLATRSGGAFIKDNA